MPLYMLLLYDDPAAWPQLSPEEMQKATEKYMAWTQEAVHAGRPSGWPTIRAA